MGDRLPCYLIGREDHVNAGNISQTDYSLDGSDIFARQGLDRDEIARRLLRLTKRTGGLEVYRATATDIGCPHIQSLVIGDSAVSIRVIGATGEDDDLLLIAKRMSEVAVVVNRAGDRRERAGI